jgi:GTP cyclohydrolase II
LSDQLSSQLVPTLVIEQVGESDSAELVEVIVVKEHMASCKGTITSSSTNLLDVVLNTSGQVKVNNRLNITLIDSHGERDSADEYSGSVFNKVILDESPLLVCLSCMVRSSGDALLVEVGSDLLTGTSLSSKDKDRGDLLESITPEESHQGTGLILITCNRELQIDSRHVELGDQMLRVLDVEELADMSLGRYCGSSSKSENTSAFA